MVSRVSIFDVTSRHLETGSDDYTKICSNVKSRFERRLLVEDGSDVFIAPGLQTPAVSHRARRVSMNSEGNYEDHCSLFFGTFVSRISD